MHTTKNLWLLLLVGLMGLSLAMFTGCPSGDDDDDDATGDDDDATDDDDDDDDMAEIKSTDPQEGDSDFYYKGNIIIEFTDEVAGAGVALADGSGGAVSGANSMNDNATILTFDPDSDLAPSTDFTATISWDGHDDVMLNFATSEVGTGTDTGAIEGGDYFLDLGSATFTEPPGVGSLLSQYIADVYVIFHVADIDAGAGSIEVYGGIVDKDGNDYVQDMCTETLEFPGGTFDDPYMQIGPTDFNIAIETYEATIIDLMIGGAFTPDGAAMVGGTFDGQMDTRVLDDLIDPGAEEGAACDLLGSLGIVCEDCPDGSGPYCLTVSAYGIVSEVVSVLAYHPETAEEFTTLQEVSADDIAGWPSCAE